MFFYLLTCIYSSSTNAAFVWCFSHGGTRGFESKTWEGCREKEEGLWDLQEEALVFQKEKQQTC